MQGGIDFFVGLIDHQHRYVRAAMGFALLSSFLLDLARWCMIGATKMLKRRNRRHRPSS